MTLPPSPSPRERHGQDVSAVEEQLRRERERADEMRRLLAAIVESSDDAIVSKTLDGTITSWNAGAERLFGHRSDEALGRPIMLIVPAELHDEERQILERVRRGEPVRHYETVRVAKDGRRIDVSLTISPIRDEAGRIVGASKVARDITDRKRTEAELTELKDRLASDLAGMVLLHEITTHLAEQNDLDSLLEEMLDAAIAITRADMGLVQLYDVMAGELRIVSHRGFSQDFLDFYASVRDGQCACAAAAERGERIVVRNVATSDVFSDEARHVALRAGVRAVQATPLFGHSGRLLGVFSTHYGTPCVPRDEDLRLLDLLSRHAADVIDRTQTEEALEQALDRINSVLRSITESYFALDSEFRFVEVNPAALRTIFRNMPASDLIGRGFWEVFPEGRDTEFDRQYHRAMEEQREVHFEARSSIVDRWFEVHAYPRNGRLEVYVHDITDRKRAEEEIQRKVIELAQADRHKDEFLALLGHELRNPLAVIANGVQVLHRAGVGDAKTRAVVDIVERQAEHMRRLIDDLLDVARVSRGKVTLRKHPIDVNELAKKVVEDLRPIVEESGCELALQTAPEPLWIEADPTRAAQIVGNLLHNACKFTNAGGRITLAAREDAEAGAAVISVRDTGIGMDEATLQRIFTPFTQADASVDRSRGGLGLGLALVRGLVELHGGSIAAYSKGPGTGTEFVVRLPLANRPGEATGGNGAAADAARDLRLRALVVDDAAPVAEVFGMLLEDLGHHVEIAHSGLEALERMKSFRPQVIFSDISMPGMNGYELAQRIRESPAGRDLPLVATTGYGQPEDRRRAKEAGFDFHLVKPADPAALKSLFTKIAPRLASHQANADDR